MIDDKISGAYGKSEIKEQGRKFTNLTLWRVLVGNVVVEKQ